MIKLRKCFLGFILLTLTLSTLTSFCVLNKTRKKGEIDIINDVNEKEVNLLNYYTNDSNVFLLKITQAPEDDNTTNNSTTSTQVPSPASNSNGNSGGSDDIFDYVSSLMDLGFMALNVIVMIIVLSLSVAFVIWWVLFVFKILPRMLADLTKRIDESYGFMGVFVFVVLFFPSLLVFIIFFMIENIELLTETIRALLGDFSDNTTQLIIEMKIITPKINQIPSRW